ncbi:hypothetical protein MKW94_013980 [Papaver nudicaule]|uniref:Uncharacterized protein n=1 Tax=Papaver nudicaule TaxID=74823 RepID=A0AA41VHE4_PAPNU|nr:hypothetical protein [Papaver nudicaule]
MSSSKQVRRVFATKVRPASYIDQQTNDTHKRIHLNPCDLLFLSLTYIQKGFLFTKQQGVNDESINSNKISHLKTSLSHTLDLFYPLAGRLAIEKHEDGAEFVHATADISVEDILSPTYVPQSIIDPLFPLNGIHPLLSVQVNELIDGIFIGCSANHSKCHWYWSSTA